MPENSPVVIALPFPLQFKRQYAASLDKDFEMTTQERLDYLTSDVRYPGQIVFDKELGKVYMLNAARDKWEDLEAAASHLTVWSVAERDILPVSTTLEGDGYSSGQRRLGMTVNTMRDGGSYQLLVPTWAELTPAERLAALSDNNNWYSVAATSVVSYDTLRTLKQEKKLVQGQFYLIADFQTIHQIEYTDEINYGPIEPISVLAVSNNAFDGIARSTLFPTDSIRYDFDDDVAEDGVTPRPGKIVYRNDVIRAISVHEDWRTIVYRRWRIKPDLYVAGTSYAKGVAVSDEAGNFYVSLRSGNSAAVSDIHSWGKFFTVGMNPYLVAKPTPERFGLVASIPVDPTDYKDYLTFNVDVDPVTFVSPNPYDLGDIHGVDIGFHAGYSNIVVKVAPGSSFYDNKFGDVYELTIHANGSGNSGGMKYNSIGSFAHTTVIYTFQFMQNTVGTYFLYNAIMGNMFDCILDSDFRTGTVGVDGQLASCNIRNYFSTFYFGSNVSYIEGAGNCGNWVITGSNFRNNFFGRQCGTLTITGNNFEYNNFPSQCGTNTIACNSFQYNTFNQRISGSTFSAGQVFQRNVFNSEIGSKTFLNGFSNCEVLKSPNGTLGGAKLKDDLTIEVVLLT